MTTTDPTPALATLLSAVQKLPEGLIQEGTDFAEFLGRKHAPIPTDYDDLTPNEHRLHLSASLKRFEEENGEENWGADYGANGDKACSPPAKWSSSIILAPSVTKPDLVIVSSAAYHLLRRTWSLPFAQAMSLRQRHQWITRFKIGWQGSAFRPHIDPISRRSNELK
jgi:hypothetical protein